jgi:hypothetical protein
MDFITFVGILNRALVCKGYLPDEYTHSFAVGRPVPAEIAELLSTNGTGRRP